ncbi:NAD(P)/FAD-dependent oxidoreductase [Halioxenophilus aromaticivorans]|uniref:FAD-binding oxidoreductase n=1 Tax=Halioxenophilus aromaticivorans TaxID=1306992 RepID=A0AAV3U1V9_9ALTE
MNDANQNWYQASRNSNAQYPPLTSNENVDVCVVGAGITGLTTALHLAERGYRVAVLEAQQVGFGASGRSGGQMIFGLAAEQPSIEKLVGKADAQKIWQASLAGLDLLRGRIAKHNIDCSYAPGHAHVAIKPRHINELKHWADDLQTHYHYPVELWDKQRTQQEINSQRYCAALYDGNSGHIHPLNYTLGLAQAANATGVSIYEHSPALSIDHTQGPAGPATITTATGSIKAQFVVLAGNAYLANVGDALRNKIMPVGTYICATQPLGQERAQALIRNNIAVADINFVLDYFRLSHDTRLLFGGRVSYSTVPPANLARAMGARMRAVFPQLHNTRIDYAWGGFVGITVNRAPHFGRLANNVYFAQGFSGHGIAATGLAGKLMADAIAGTAEQFDVFTRIPHMAFPGGRLLRTPALVLAMAYYRLKDLLP